MMDTLYDILIQMFFLFLTVYIYQNIYYQTIKIKSWILPLFLGSMAINVLFNYFDENIICLGIGIFLIFSAVLYLINFNNHLQLLYFSAFFTTLIFYLYILIELSIWGIKFNLNSISYVSYVETLLFSVIILSLLVYSFKLRFFLPTGRINIFILFSTISLLLIELIFYDQFPNIASWKLAHIFMYIVMGLICINNNIVIQYLYNDSYQLSLTLQNNFLSKVTKSYVNELNDKQTKTVKIKHDLKNKIIILHQLLNENKVIEATEIITDLDQDLSFKSNHAYTDNIIIDAYLSYITTNSNLTFKIKSNNLADLNYHSDFLSLFINIVDNAIENAISEVTIKLDYQKDDNILLKVSNDCNHDPSKNLKKSTKKGNHGYGLRIVQDIINKYLGTYITDYKNNVFTTYILLNLGEAYEK